MCSNMQYCTYILCILLQVDEGTKINQCSAAALGPTTIRDYGPNSVLIGRTVLTSSVVRSPAQDVDDNS